MLYIPVGKGGRPSMKKDQSLSAPLSGKYAVKPADRRDSTNGRHKPGPTRLRGTDFPGAFGGSSGPLQFRPHIGGRLPRLVWIRGEASLDDMGKFSGQSRHGERLLLGGTFADSHFIQHQPERISVSTRIDRAALELFGSHIGRCPDDHRRRAERFILGGSSKTKIEYFDAAFGNHDVARF